MRICSILCILVGVLLIALSPLWHRVASSQVFWDEAEVQEYSSSVAEMHHAHTEAAIDPNKSKQATEAQHRFKRNQAKLNRARQFRNRGGKIMRWMGAVSAIVGVALYQLSKPSDD